MEDEDTPLHGAVRFGAIDEVKQCLELGDDPNTNGFYRWSSLHEAVNIDEPEILKMLLQNGGDPNIPDNCNGSTPVHMAAKLGYAECLSLMVEHGGDVNHQNRDGKTPQDIASGPCIPLMVTLEQERVTSSSSISSRYKVLEQGERRRHDQLLSLTRPVTKVTRPPSTLSVRSMTSVRSTESILTTRSSPVRGPTAQRTTRKPVGANTSYVNKAPGIRLSVEYSEDTSLLKIRVWSVQYVTIPGSIATSNSTTHVRCCVFPGTKIWSKTEDIPIEKYLPSKDAESGVQSKGTNFDQPLTLQSVPMDRKMTFKSISESELGDKNLEIVLCCKTPTKISSKVHHMAKLFLKCDEAVNVVMPKWFLMTSCSFEKSYPSTQRVTSRDVITPRATPHDVITPRATPHDVITPRAVATSHQNVTSRDSSSSKSRDSTPDLQFYNPVFETRPASAGSGRQDPPLLSSPSLVSTSSSVVSVCNIKITEPINSSAPPINKISSSIPMKNPFRKDRHDRNHAKAVTSRNCMTSRDKNFETRLEMGELDSKSKVLVTDKIDKTSRSNSKSNGFMKETV
ncbi:uncharacterized protein LOC134814034 isoform X2 [Bolinopsis microptera]|uniref:uncharacterized protein LOC134814034 isoform X2 n=1 Tax=Bolinopsis microptera TaxID=2820187 RepID=UPI00307B0705